MHPAEPYKPLKRFLTAVYFCPMIGPELAAFLEEGLGVHVGTRDAGLRPQGCRGLGVRVEDGGRQLTVFIARVAADRLIPDLESNGHVAVTVGRPIDERSCQVKGTVIDWRDASEGERPLALGQYDGYLTQLERIGIPRAISSGWVTWPAVAVRLKVTALFEQTPGKRAGEALS